MVLYKRFKHFEMKDQFKVFFTINIILLRKVKNGIMQKK